MITKETYSIPAIWQPDLEPANALAKQIASSGVEVTALKLTAGSTAATISLYDTSSGVAKAGDLRWRLDSPTQGNDTQTFHSPLAFKQGIYAVLEQGTGGNPSLNIGIIASAV